MNDEEAKQILALYRPGTDDRSDPLFKEALERAKPASDLGLWFQQHCSSHLGIRGKFRDIPVPPGLKNQILGENKVCPMPARPLWPTILLRLAAALVLCLGLATLLWPSHG